MPPTTYVGGTENEVLPTACVSGAEKKLLPSACVGGTKIEGSSTAIGEVPGELPW